MWLLQYQGNQDWDVHLFDIKPVRGSHCFSEIISQVCKYIPTNTVQVSCNIHNHCIANSFFSFFQKKLRNLGGRSNNLYTNGSCMHKIRFSQDGCWKSLQSVCDVLLKVGVRIRVRIFNLGCCQECTPSTVIYTCSNTLVSISIGFDHGLSYGCLWLSLECWGGLVIGAFWSLAGRACWTLKMLAPDHVAANRRFILMLFDGRCD